MTSNCSASNSLKAGIKGMDFSGETAILRTRTPNQLDPGMALGISGNDFRGAIIRSVIHNDPSFRQRSLRDHGVEGLRDEGLLVMRGSDESIAYDVRCQMSEGRKQNTARGVGAEMDKRSINTEDGNPRVESNQRYRRNPRFAFCFDRLQQTLSAQRPTFN